jgi:hypothetical protein
MSFGDMALREHDRLERERREVVTRELGDQAGELAHLRSVTEGLTEEVAHLKQAVRFLIEQDRERQNGTRIT